MASIKKIQRAKGAVYKVTIRQSGNGTVCKTFPLKKQALEFARTVEGDNKLLSALGNPVNKTLTLSILIDEFMEQYSGRDQTIIGHLLWWQNRIGYLTIGNVNVALIRETLKLLSTGNCLHKGSGKLKELDRKRSGSTVNRYKGHLSSVFEYGKEHYGLTDNPCREIKAKPESKGRTRFLSDVERTNLLEACKNSKWDKLYLLVLMALTTGARQSELLHLTYKDINFKERIAHLWTTKNGEQRLLPLTEEVIGLLRQFKQSINPGSKNVVKLGESRPNLIFGSPTLPHKPFVFRKHWNK